MPAEGQMQIVSWFKETKNYLLVVTAAAFVLGFGDLVRGGITLSALSLTVAYCVLLPLLIWRWGPVDDGRGERPSYRAAAIASACVLALYLVTLAPSTAMWDTSEYI